MKIFFIVASDQIKKEPIILTPCQFSSHLKQNRHRVNFYFDMVSVLFQISHISHLRHQHRFAGFCRGTSCVFKRFLVVVAAEAEA